VGNLSEKLIQVPRLNLDITFFDWLWEKQFGEDHTIKDERVCMCVCGSLIIS